MKFKFGIKEVVAIGIGTALFVALTEIQIPTPIPNTYLQPRMAIMAFLAAVFGPLVGGVVGLLGHAIGDAMFYGSVWWSWVFPDGSWSCNRSSGCKACCKGRRLQQYKDDRNLQCGSGDRQRSCMDFSCTGS